MRRALLTAGSQVIKAGLITAGSTAVTGRNAFTKTNPVSASGSLTKFTIPFGTISGTPQIHFYSVNPATMTVRAIVSPGLSVLTGLNEYVTGPLTVVAGDYIGCRVEGNCQYMYDFAGGGGFQYITTSPFFAVGTNVSSFGDVSSPNNLCLSATS